MKLIIKENDLEMSKSTMHILLGAMMQDKRVNISLTSGRSPKTLYQLLVPEVKNKKEFENITYYLFDDSPYIGKEHGQNWDEMQEMFFKPAEIDESRIKITTLDNWKEYDEIIKNDGGIDVMVIGLGYDGHFCGNCPRCTILDSYTYCLEFREKQKVNPDYKDRPYQPYSITMGPKSLMKVKHLVMIVNGEEKAEILKRFLDEEISNENPSTILKLHPNFTVICDKEAAKYINEKDYERI